MAQDQLQTLKLEISKNTQLLPYERISLHKILGISKTENGMRVLIKELNSSSLIRESAVFALKDFNYKDVQDILLVLLKKQISENETIYIFDHLEKYGTIDSITGIIEYIENNKMQYESLPVLAKAFNALRAIGSANDSKNLKDFLKSIALNKELGTQLRALSILAISPFKEIVITQSGNKSFLEEILKENSEDIICAAYNSMSMLNDNIIKQIQQNKKEEEELFTYSPEKEDRVILDIRVLIGKMTSHFDAYPINCKIALLNAMISSNHRELLLYLMKSLTSGNQQLTNMTLDLLLANTHKILDPDKLFRNLISLSTDSPRGNELIVNIFEKYFKELKETRRNLLFRDKIYNYLVVTLETYFETYRKDFMVAEVVEKNYPENVRRIRQFILNKLTPNLKKKTVNFLRSNDISRINNVLSEIADSIPYISEIEKEDFTYFLEMLSEKDPKSREISASRIDDINFEKRYLKDRIIRICNIIGILKIDNGASPLVIIYNYIKKYTDKDIMDAVSYTLSMLNYSYMLGELEIMLSTGDDAEQQKSVKYLSLFSDQRSLNIILDYLKQKTNSESDVVIKLLNTLLRQDLFGNSSAGSLFKEIIDINPNIEIKSLAILCLGKCAREPDIAYLDSKFNLLKDNPSKETIVQSIEHIIENGLEINKRPVKNMLTEYIKDPGIKVRIYACYLLLKIGNKNALKSIMDMMMIKNKKIQREIITIFAGLNSVEFAYFLISLIKDEYAISADIISLIKLLPPEELKEIDHFIINIFKKHESIGYSDSNAPGSNKPHPVNGLSEGQYYLLNIEIPAFHEKVKHLNIIESKLILQQINDIIISEIINSNGILTCVTAGKITAYYKDPVIASKIALSINENFRLLNNNRLSSDRINIYIQLINNKIKIINNEIINFDDSKMSFINSLPFYNRILLDEPTKHIIEKNFYCEPLPDFQFTKCTLNDNYHEIIGHINFLILSEIILDNIAKENTEKEKKEIELETELKQKQADKTKSSAAITYAQAMDDIGRILKNDLNEINKYVQKRTTDRELIANVEKMLSNTYKRYFVEKSKFFSELE